jgi:flavin reductase (NADH)
VTDTMDSTRSRTFADIGDAEFRSIMGSFASGVTVVTTLDDEDRPYGLTCSAVCSVSAEPPLLLSCVRRPSTTLDMLSGRGQFAVNFLDSQACDLSRAFASRQPDRFAGVQWRPGRAAGMPILDRTLAHAECDLHDVISAGDHVIVLGRIVGGGIDATKFPLGYWRGNYVRLFRMTASARG